MGTDVKSGSRAEATLSQRLIQTLGDEPLTRDVLAADVGPSHDEGDAPIRKGRDVNDLLGDKERKSTEKV